MGATNIDVPAPERQPRVKHHQPNGIAFRMERESTNRGPKRVAWCLVRLGDEEDRDVTVGESRVPWLYRRARYLAITRILFAFTCACLCIYFAVRGKDDPPLLGFGIFGIIHGFLHLHPFDVRYEMRSRTDARPKMFYTVRLAYYTVGWLALAVLSLVIGITGIVRDGNSNTRRDLPAPSLLESRRVRFGGRRRTGLVGWDITAAEEGILYTCATLAVICLLWNWSYVYRLHARCFSDEEVEVAPFLMDNAMPRVMNPEEEREAASRLAAEKKRKHRVTREYEMSSKYVERILRREGGEVSHRHAQGMPPRCGTGE